jgi:hypothetical protein
MFSDHLAYGPRTKPHWAHFTHPRLPGMRHIVASLAEATIELRNRDKADRPSHRAMRQALRAAGGRNP